MTNYENVWSSAQKDWCSIDYRGTYILKILTVFAWVGMVGAFISLLFVFVDKSDLSAAFLFGFMSLWLACGIAVIRIRRTKRRVVTIVE